MVISRPLFLSSLLLLWVFLVGLGGSSQAASAGYAPDELLVKFGNGGRVGPALAARLATAQFVNAQIKTSKGAARTLRDFAFIGWQHVKLPPGLSVPDAIARFKKLKGVIDVQPNYLLHASDTTPNDPSYSQLWGMAKIKAPTAWDTTTGDSNLVVADIDTGVDYNHPDLAANMWHNPGEIAGNGIDDDGDGYVDDVYGMDAANNDGDPMDDNVHGTHCAGTIGAVGNNGVGVVGVNWGVKIMALKYLDASGSGYSNNAITCLQYALALKTRAVNPVNIRVTSNSWGGTGYDSALKDAFDALGNAGVINICAAGNSAANNDNSATASYPSSFTSDSIVAVAASDQNDNRASFSNYGATSVDLAAPGVSILSTLPGNAYGNMSGTSMATPHVAGAAALKLAQNPSLSVADLKALLIGTVDKVDGLRGLVASGGRLNLDRLLRGDQTYKDLRLLAPSASSTVASPNLMRATYDSFPVEAPARVDFVAQRVFRSLPNKLIGSTVSDSISVNASGTVSSISGSFTIDFVSAGNYSIYLTAPDGTMAQVSGLGAPGDNLGIYTFSFSPSTLTPFVGKKLPGLWTLTVTTGSSSNQAVLKSWDLNFGNVLAPQTLSDTDGPDGNGEYTATWAPAGGVYNVTATAYNAAGAVLDSETHTDVQVPVILQSGPSFVVTNTGDADDGVCSTEDCSLREATNAANTYSGNNGGATATISFDATVFAAPRKTITFSGGSLTIAARLNITAPTAGVTLDGNHLSPLFSFTGSVGNVTLSSLNLINAQGSAITVDHGGTLNLDKCTLSGNAGGAAITNRSTATLTNCTLTGNAGGAIYSESSLTVSNSTIAGNTTTGSIGGISVSGSSTFSLNNSIVAGNSNSSGNSDIAGTVTAGDYNLVQTTTGATLSGTHNVTGQAPSLGALAENGGPTPTMALLTGSPAVNAGNPAFDGSGQTDQRGVGYARVVGAAVDIGAYELGFINHAPTDLLLSNSSVAENAAVGTSVGTLSSTDADTGDTFTYALVTGTGSDDNASFTIEGNTLKTAAVFDFETKSSYSIRVKTTDAAGATFEKALTITVTNVNELPAINTATLPAARVSVAYSQTLAASDPDGDTLSWNVTTGALPTGLTLSTAGVLSGTPTSAGTFNFTITVSDGNGGSDSKAYSLLVKDASSVSVTLSSTSPKTSDVLTATPSASNFDGSLTYTYAWKKGTTVLSTTGPTLDLSQPGNGDRGDVITVTVTATDGTSSATSAPVSATVANTLPINSSISPAFIISTYGTAKYFTATYSDGDGFADISNVQMIVGAALGTVNVLNVSYDAPTNKLYLRNDAGTALLGGFAPGSANTITNSQGSLNCAATTVGRNGTTLTVNWNLTPTQAFIGTKNLYLYSKDAAGATAGWNDLGDWVVKASTNSAPSNTSLAPASSANIVNTPRSFGAVYSDADGALDIGNVQMLINTTLNTSNALWCYYDSPTNKLYLKDDAGTTLIGGFAPGSANVISTSQGTLNCAGTVVARNGNALTVYWNVTPSASFVGTKNVFMYVKDSAGATAGWNDLGDWLVKSPTNTAPTLVSLAPANSANIVNTPRSFGAVYSDGDGALDITSVQFIINATLTQANGLVPSYDPATDKLFLKNDAGTALIGGFTPGSANVISNSQGSLNCANTVVVRNGNTLTVYWNVTPSASFTGVKNLYQYVRDASNASAGFTDMGDWLVKTSTNVAPTVVSVTPNVSSSAVGTAKSLSAVYSDADGALDIASVQFIINSTLTQTNGFAATYDLATNKLFLKNDAGTTLIGGFEPGSANVISNSQGSLNCAATTVTRSGNNLTVNWNFTPASSFTGTKNLYLFDKDTAGASAGFTDKGDWNITSSGSLAVPTTQAPSGGSS